MKVCVECDGKFSSEGWKCPVCSFSPPVDGAIPLFAPTLSAENDGFSAAYFDELEILEPKNFWFRARNNLIIRVLQKYCPSMQKFMEIGCGTGFVLSAIATKFPNVEIVGSEIFSKGLAHASRRVPRARLIQADAQKLPYEAHFDAIGAFDVLEHIENDERVLNQLYRALIPGGTLILTVPQHRWLWSKQDELAHHIRRYGAQDLSAKVVAAGFSVLHCRSFVSLLLPLLWLARHRVRSDQRSDALIELRTGNFVNGVLSLVMQIEFFLYGIGLRLPLGGSLLLVARKPSV